MKQILLSIFLLLTLTAAAETVTALRVVTAGSEPVDFALDRSPEVRFSGSALVITSLDQPVGLRFEIDNVESMDFVEVSGIDAVAAADATPVRITLEGATVTFSNIPEGTAVDIFTADGRRVAADRAAGGVCSFTPARGVVYIVRIGGFATKITL